MPLSCARLEGRQDAIEVRGILVNFSGSGALFIAALGIQSVLVFSCAPRVAIACKEAEGGWGGADFSALELVARAME